jgi:hypothetical protein
MEHWDVHDHMRHFCFSADAKDMVALASSPDHLVEICDIVVRLLAVSPVHRLIMHNVIPLDQLINATTLAYLMEQCQSLKFLSFKNLEMDESHCRVLGAYSRPDFEIELNLVALARSPMHLLEICDIVLRLLAASVVQSIIMQTIWDSAVQALINATTLAYLMEQCQSLKALSLKSLEMDEDHCRVLSGYARPDLEIVLAGCKLTSAGTRALAEVLGQNQRPTKLDLCEIDSFTLANGLRGNSRLKSLRSRFSSNPEVHSRDVLTIAGALKQNKGLVDLDLSNGLNLSDETWDAVCDSLKTHPTLQVLNVRTIPTFGGAGGPSVIKPRIQALLDMLTVNMLIHTIHLHAYYRHHELYRRSVVPYLETNQLRPRLLAIQKTRPIAYRAKVMGRALLKARTDANSFWMILSGNAEVVFSSTTATIAAAGNLTKPAIAAANYASTANVATVAVSVMSGLTTTATSSLATADAADTTAPSAVTPSISDAFAITVVDTAGAANAATLLAGQKRKARP